MKTDLFLVLGDIVKFAVEQNYDGEDFDRLLTDFRRSEHFSEYRPKMKKIANGLRGRKSWSVTDALLDSEKQLMTILNVNEGTFPEIIKFEVGNKVLAVPVLKNREGVQLRKLSYQIGSRLIRQILSSNIISDANEFFYLFGKYRSLLEYVFDEDGVNIRLSKTLKQKLERNLEPEFILMIVEKLVEIDGTPENIELRDRATELYREYADDFEWKKTVPECLDYALETLPDVQRRYITERGEKLRYFGHLHVFADSFSYVLNRRDSGQSSELIGAKRTLEADISAETMSRIHHYSRNSLIAAEMLFNYMQSGAAEGKTDYSLVCYCYCRAVEIELNQRIIYPLVDRYENFIIENNLKVDNRQSNKYYLYDFAHRRKNEDGSIDKSQFRIENFDEFAGYTAMVSDIRYGESETAERRKDWKLFTEAAAAVCMTDAADAEARFRKAIPIISRLNSEFRKVAVHPNSSISADAAARCREMVCGSDGVINIIYG